ncbi:MAG: hypothetical protein NTU97_00665, partial [Candidatus Magasanikbacteria bacterium]|nr:hypothetical protein [Candidatus Magasanikbacteria bacterium]
MPTEPENLNGVDEDLTEKQLKWGYWYTTHRPQLYKSLIWSLVVFCILLGGYNIYYWGDYLIFGYTNDQKLMLELRSNILRSPNLLEHFAAKPITIGGVISYPAGDKTDALAMVSNPDPDFIATIDYSFVLNGQKLETRQSVVLPSENKYIAELGIKGGGVVDFNLIKVSWQRISAHKISNPVAYKEARIQFELLDFNYSSSPYSRISFSIKNNSFFGYYQANFLVLLRNYENIIGVEKIVIDNFPAGSKQLV